MVEARQAGCYATSKESWRINVCILEHSIFVQANACISHLTEKTPLTLTGQALLISRLSSQKGRRQKKGVPWDLNRGPLAPQALSTYSTPLGCHCPGSDFVPIHYEIMTLKIKLKMCFFCVKKAFSAGFSVSQFHSDMRSPSMM